MKEEKTDRHAGNILVVDDTTANLHLLTNLLTEHGYTVYPASDAELALELVKSTLPDLILLGIRLPDMDGFEVCRRLRADERTRNIPVIFISIQEDQRDTVKGFRESAVDYITRPIQPDEVLARIALHLRLRELTERLEQKVTERTEELTRANQRLQQEIAERRRAEEEVRKIEWMLTKKPVSMAGGQGGPEDDQGYGDLTALNRGGLIASSIDKEVLRGISSEYLDLLNTSSAIYEKNGDYAFGIFSSRWCRLMDRASRTLCATDDNTEALACGKWLCHESCWTDCSRRAIEAQEPVDIECNGGIRLYSVPIFAGGEVIGAINFGYGDPPKEPEKLRSIAESYQVDYEELVREAGAYDSRPGFIIEMAKQRLQVSARLIGVLVERRQAEEALRNSSDLLRAVIEAAPVAVIGLDLDGQVHSVWNPAAEKMLGWTAEEVMGHPLPTVPRDHQEEFAHFREMIRHGMTLDGVEVCRQRRDGTPIHYSIYASPLHDTEGRIAGNIAVLVDITERKRADEILAERIMLAELTTDIGASLARQRDLQTMLKECAEALVRHLDAAFARIWTFNPDESLLELRASAGMYTHIDGAHSRVPLGKYKIGLIADERRPHVTNSVIGDPRVHDQEWAIREGMVSFAGHPLMLADKVVGVMALFSRKPLTDVTLKALAFVADGIAVGIERNTAEQELKKLNEELEQRVRERTKELERRNFELEQMNKVFVGRELKMVELKERIRELEQAHGGIT